MLNLSKIVIVSIFIMPALLHHSHTFRPPLKLRHHYFQPGVFRLPPSPFDTTKLLQLQPKNKNLQPHPQLPPVNDNDIDISIKLRNLDESLSRCGPIDIRELTISQTQKLFHSGALTSTQLTKCYLTRIQLIDPILKSVIQVNPAAMQIAEQADKERILKTPTSKQSPLHGIPVLIKDNIGTADGMETTAGAIVMERLIPKIDSELVTRLRASGSIIIGKTNPSEWAKYEFIYLSQKYVIFKLN
jgi:hypothetical protein